MIFKLIESPKIRQIKVKIRYLIFNLGGRITAVQILHYIDEREHSVVAPSFHRLFDVLDKIDNDAVTFEEFVPGLISYCLFSRSEVLGFVYSMLDEDKDEYISKTDLFKYLL